MARDSLGVRRRNPPRGLSARELERRIGQGYVDLWPQLFQARDREGVRTGRSWLRGMDPVWHAGRPPIAYLRDLPTGASEVVANAFGVRVVDWRLEPATRYVWLGIPSELVLLRGYRFPGPLYGGEAAWEIAAYLFDHPGDMIRYESSLILEPEPGDRVELIGMHEDPDPVPPGAKGTVLGTATSFSLHVAATATGVSRLRSLDVSVNWDNGRSLSMVSPPDEFRILWGEH